MLTQWLFNNLWHGEQQRERDNLRSAVAVLLLPDKSAAWGIDISHWNTPPVSLAYMRDNFGLMFVIIKGCDGAIRSRYFDQHRQTAIDAGLPWGVYNWLYPNGNVSISAQTTAWANQAKEIEPPMGVFIDAETTKYAGVYVYPKASDLRTAHDQLKSKWKQGKTYTSPGYAKEHLKGFDFSRELLWLAQYRVSSPTPPAGAVMELWQNTDNLDGAVLDPRPDGNLELDGNLYNGTRQEFTAKYGGIVAPPVEEPMTTGIINATAGLRLRSDTSTTANILGVIPYNTIVELNFKRTVDGILWYNATWNNLTGFLAADYIRSVVGVVPDETTTPPATDEIITITIDVPAATVTTVWKVAGTKTVSLK